MSFLKRLLVFAPLVFMDLVDDVFWLIGEGAQFDDLYNLLAEWADK